jgi:uncharacterized protein YjbI with pentapeptide repeats
MRHALFDGDVDPDTQRPRSLFARSLVLADEVLIGADDLKAFRDDPEKAQANILRTVVLRGRDLRHAVLDRVDLRRADLIGARMEEASLIQAKLTGTYLDRVHLQRASLNLAQLRGTSLMEAQLQGASLLSAQMQGAILGDAQLQSTILYRTQLQGAWLYGAQLQGAWLYGAQLQAASFADAQLQGASLDGAQLQGASLDGAQLQGASLDGAQLQGASLRRVKAWRLKAHQAELAEALIVSPLYDDEPPCAEPPDQGEPCKLQQSWAQKVETWLTKATDDLAKGQLAVLLFPNDPPGAEEARKAWEGHPRPDPAAIVHLLGDLACDTKQAPYVAKGILRQILRDPDALDFRDIGPHRVTLAARMVNSETCPGARGLADDERALLAEIIADQSPGRQDTGSGTAAER